MVNAAKPAHFAVLAWDAPGAAALRETHKLAHFAHIVTMIDRLAIAGPLRDGDGAFTGSLLIVRAADDAAALAMLQSDPYFAAGVWSRWEIRAFTPAAGEWIGGKSW